MQDVRIPYQQKRMFGFVTFVYPETVKIILAKGNPHFVCDSRVLVKPYKEKGKIPDKYNDHTLSILVSCFMCCFASYIRCLCCYFPILGSNISNSNSWRGESFPCVQAHLGLILESLLTSSLVSK